MRSAHRRRPRRPNLTSKELDAIPLWVELGARPLDIAEALGTSVNSLYNLCARHNISLRPSRETLVGALSDRQWAVLRDEAARRGLPVWDIVAKVVIGVVDHGLFAAVLGDYDRDLPPDEEGS